MAQNWNKFTAFWMNTAIAPGTPLTGLAATINIRDLSGTLVINAQAMTELGGWWYLYTFAQYDNQKEYVYDCNPGATAYRESGVTDKRLDNLDKNLSQINGGGFSSWNDFSARDRDNIEKMKKIIETIPNEFNETNSHISLAKDETIGTINEVETEICTDIVKSKKDLKDDNVATRQFIRQKTKNLAELAQKQLDSEVKRDKTIDSEIKEIESKITQNIKDEIKQIEKQIQIQIDKEIEDIESNQSHDDNNNATAS